MSGCLPQAHDRAMTESHEWTCIPVFHVIFIYFHVRSCFCHALAPLLCSCQKTRPLCDCAGWFRQWCDKVGKGILLLVLHRYWPGLATCAGERWRLCSHQESVADSLPGKRRAWSVSAVYRIDTRRAANTTAPCNCPVNCFHDPGPFPVFPGATMRFRGEALNSLTDVQSQSHSHSLWSDSYFAQVTNPQNDTTYTFSWSV